jgi:hypothetical protein
VIASGTTDRGRGVYFKLRWTTQQVLEGEKHFRLSVAVPESWRGGLVDVMVTANGVDRSLFGTAKLRPLATREFVIAVHQQNDPEAAAIALRLAHLDRELAMLSREHASSSPGGILQLWRRMIPSDAGHEKEAPNWYRSITSGPSDPDTDKRIRSLPMPVRVAVIGYTEATRELCRLGDPL